MIPYIATHYAGCKYRSRTEARWGVFFDAVGIRFQYEDNGFALDAGAYLPDFWLPGLQMFLEVKGQEPTDAEREKCRELAERSERVVLLAIGAPEERFQILWFDGESDDDRLWVIARDRRSNAGLWLVADDDARWLGGGDITGHRRRWGPMFSGALEEAYAAARSARFERGEGRARQARILEADPNRMTA